MKSLSKEIFIIALLLMIVVFMIGMIFYEYMPNNKTIPEPITYVADSTTTSVLQEISTSSDTTATNSETQSVIKSYSIGTKELSTAASKQSYTSGKTNPFAKYETAPSTDAENNKQNTSNNATTSTTKDANSTGTFFESKNSK